MKKSEEQLQDFSNEMPTNGPLPPIRVEIQNLASMVSGLGMRLYTIEQAQQNINNRMAEIEQKQNDPELVHPPLPVKGQIKKAEPVQKNVPVWQQKPLETPEPAKKQNKVNSGRIILFIAMAVIVMFLIGNCQSIMSYMQPAAGG